MRLIDADALLQKFNDKGIQITFDLPVEEILGEDVDIDDFSMLVQDAIKAYRKMVIDTIKNQPTAFDTEKVVEQTNNVLQDLNVIEILSQFDPDSTIQTSLDRFLNAVRNEVLNIVKKGGVE